MLARRSATETNKKCLLSPIGMRQGTEVLDHLPKRIQSVRRYLEQGPRLPLTAGQHPEARLPMTADRRPEQDRRSPESANRAQGLNQWEATNVHLHPQPDLKTVPGRRLRPHAALTIGPSNLDQYRRADRKDRQQVKTTPHGPMPAPDLPPDRMAGRLRRPAVPCNRKSRTVFPRQANRGQKERTGPLEPTKILPRTKAGSRPNMITAVPSAKANINAKRKIPSCRLRSLSPSVLPFR